MFKFKRNGQKNSYFSLMHIIPSLIVFLAFLGVVLWSAFDAKKSVDSDHSQALAQTIDQTQKTITERLESYENILRAGAGLFGASDEVNRAEWKNFTSVLQENERYKGVGGIGYVDLIKPSDLTQHIDQIRQTYDQNYTVYPAGKRDLYTSIVYLEPADQNNLKAIGYDMYSEPTRRKAMDLARDTDQATITDIIKLIQDDSVDFQPGLLMYIPLFQKNNFPKNTEDRQKYITGFIYAPFRTYDLLNTTVENINENFGFQLHDGVVSANSKIYESPGFSKISESTDHKLTSQSFAINNQEWVITGVLDSKTISAVERNRPTWTLWGGLMFSFFVAGFVYLFILNRARDLAIREELEIQQAKDELLALASHQLRTPATGVKQYVGMLLDDFAGKLTPDQKRLLNKAYESNERQLATINEMLFVARTDAGQLKMERSKVNLCEMVRDIVEEHSNLIKQRNQTKIVKIPKKPIYVFGDRQYLRMALENIVNNATKYTPENGSISIMLSRKESTAVFKVKDTGVGVDPAEHSLLFKKFSRIPNELTTQVSGSGIGLYLAKQVIDYHNGTITFTAAKNSGSIVQIILPLTDS